MPSRRQRAVTWRLQNRRLLRVCAMQERTAAPQDWRHSRRRLAPAPRETIATRNAMAIANSPVLVVITASCAAERPGPND